MTAAQGAGLSGDDIVAVLTAHAYRDQDMYGYPSACECGWVAPRIVTADDDHRAHVAEHLARRERTAVAAALTTAAEGEGCRRCGGPNVIWSAASPLWNKVMRGNDILGEPRYGDMVCMPCFIACAIEAGLPAHGWRLTLHPEPNGLIYETPSGRVWDEERFIWVESGARG